ncbi:MAG: VWA domain-containing protein [Acidimicrobiia bacterium]|nr:VWA domain-containing protein [Acidimicrobiia bacterium]
MTESRPLVAAARPENICALTARFGVALRDAGLAVPVGSMITFMAALGSVGVDSRAKVYWSGRATLVHRPEDFDTYDVVFTRFWEGIDPQSLLPPPPTVELTLAFDDLEGGGGDGETDDDSDMIAVRYSPYELLRDKDFADCTAKELAELAELMSRLRLGGVMRRSRRLQPVRVPRGRPDLRRTVRRALQAGGEPITRSFRQPGEQPRRLVLLLDVSGSMESYARALLRFVHAAVVARRRVEAFALGTRLTRLTRELSTRDPDSAFDRAAGVVQDWSGGTRLGESIGVFCDLWGVRGMARGAVVVILSDGWDRGEPTTMTESMGRLSRVAHKVIWVNPLKATPGYAPLAQGMAAALPFVDEFVEGHSLASLEELADRVAA